MAAQSHGQAIRYQPMGLTSDREASHIRAATIEQRVRTLGRYYPTLGIDPPAQVESTLHGFEKQVQAAIDAKVPALSFIFEIPPPEILGLSPTRHCCVYKKELCVTLLDQQLGMVNLVEE